jgi:hypothetical protein
MKALDFPPHVRAALDAGRTWRAREILQGRIASMPYDAARYEQYGAVLLALGDVAEAGRFLFFSGARDAEYADAIDVFLTRHDSAGRLSSAMPTRVRGHVTALPRHVQDELRARGWTAPATKPLLRPPRTVRARVQETIAAAGCVVLAIFAVVSFFTGAGIVIARIARWLW